MTSSQKVSLPQHCNIIGISLKYYFKLLKSAQNIGSLELKGRKFNFGKRGLPFQHICRSFGKSMH